MVGSVSKKKR